MTADTLLTHIHKLYTPASKPPVHGKQMNEVACIEDAFLAIKADKILDFGSHSFIEYISSNTEVIDCHNLILTPGFIDSHTHLVHAGSRELESIQIANAVPYLEILKQGGGILSTVKETRNASFDDLYKKASLVLDNMLSFGVTTIEAKSGYGLDILTELKQLEVAISLNKKHPIDIYSTYLGAHAIPKEFKDDRDQYVKLIIDSMIKIKELNLADAVDVFFETGVFDYKETKKILENAKSLGFRIHLHADEMTSLRGAKLGVEMNANSIDHLMAISDEDVALLKDSNIICNLLPSTSFFLNKPFAQARFLIDSSAAVAISSDYNPGSAPSENFQFSMQLALFKMKLSPYEILTATTINPAYHLGIDKEVGSITIGKKADLVLIDVPNLEYFYVNVGINHVSKVYKSGKLVFSNSMK
jgi:imidazolonepropionase